MSYSNKTEDSKPKPKLLAAFKYKNFKYFWTGALLSNIGTWMQTIALGWFVYSLTNSTFNVGLVNFCSNIPVLFIVLFAGVAADRINRKNLIIWTQTGLMILAFLLGIFVSFKHANMQNIIIITLIAGVMNAIGIPAWQAFISDIVPREDLLNAISLNSAQFHAARLVGPALAGFVLSEFGPAANFYINSVSFLTVIIALVIIHPLNVNKPSIKKEDILVQLKSGFIYAAENPVVIRLLIITGIISFFGLAYIVLMPTFARDILKSDAKGYGLLMGANGFGALLGALITAYLANISKKNTLIRVGSLFFGFFLILFALSVNFKLSMALMVCVGTFFLITVSSLNTSIQEIVPHKIRGRIMSMYAWMFMGLMPIGGLLFGAIAEKISPSKAAIISGSVIIFTSIILIIKPSIIEANER